MTLLTCWELNSGLNRAPTVANPKAENVTRKALRPRQRLPHLSAPGPADVSTDASENALTYNLLLFSNYETVSKLECCSEQPKSTPLGNEWLTIWFKNKFSPSL